MLSYIVREPCAVAAVKLNLIKRSANKAGWGEFDLIIAMPGNTCHLLGCPALWHSFLSSLPMDIHGDILCKQRKGKNKEEKEGFEPYQFYFQVLYFYSSEMKSKHKYQLSELQTNE